MIQYMILLYHEQTKNLTREKILLSALALFSERGIAKTSPQ